MNHLWNLIRKELKELLTPASIASILVVAVMFGVMGGTINTAVEDAMTFPTVGLINEDAGTYEPSAYIDEYYTMNGITDPSSFIVTMTSPANDANAIISEMEGLGLTVALVFGPTYSSDIADFVATGTGGGNIDVYWYGVESGALGSVPTAIVDSLLSYIDAKTSREIMGVGGTGDKLLPLSHNSTTYFNGKMYANKSPADISSALQSQSLLMPMLIMIIITMIGSMIISSMGNEKENKTLETLLTLPVKRTTIVSGKLIGSALAGLAFGMVYMLGMYFYMNSVMGSGTLSLDNPGLTLTLIDWTIVAAMIFLAIMSALGICMILGAFVKNAKAAQTLTLPISVLAMIPMFVTMFIDFNSLPAVFQIALFMIPFSHPMMVMNNLMLGNTFMIWAGLGYLVAFALLMIYITVRIYNSDILLTGFIRNNDKKKGVLSPFTKR